MCWRLLVIYLMNVFFPIYFRTRFQLPKNQVGARVTRSDRPVWSGSDNLDNGTSIIFIESSAQNCHDPFRLLLCHSQMITWLFRSVFVVHFFFCGTL